MPVNANCPQPVDSVVYDVGDGRTVAVDGAGIGCAVPREPATAPLVMGGGLADCPVDEQKTVPVA